MQIRRSTIDGAKIVVDYDDSLGPPGPFQSRALFAVPKHRSMVFEATPPGYAENLRSRSSIRPDLREVETSKTPVAGGVIRSAVVEQVSAGLADPPAVTRFTLTLLERQHGCILTTGSVRERQLHVDLMASLEVDDAPTGLSIGLPIDVSVRPPICGFHLPNGGLVLIEPLTPSRLSAKRLGGEVRTSSAGQVLQRSTAQSAALLVYGADTCAEAIRTQPDDDIERLADQLVVSWTKG